MAGLFSWCGCESQALFTYVEIVTLSTQTQLVRTFKASLCIKDLFERILQVPLRKPKKQILPRYQ